ncbi:Hypothetical predicted protein [Mytilus galloprovincialis]|uniref:Uncharacterized protein n=1 Tax=Mytilus galloprovincialis TaxID=29158 RepID=A0A8B6FK70_MYTGA|nr:Hypothetical predicted protein [Mytilus galloprovincialis]
MEENCINCGKHFEKKNKGYKRKSVDSNTKFPAVSVRKILEISLGSPVTPTKNLYICDSCASLCVKIDGLKDSTKKTFDEFERSKCDRSYLGKRKKSFSTPSKTVESISPFSPPLFASPLFRLLQAETNVTRAHFLQMAADNESLQKLLKVFLNNKKEQALERIFTEQTVEESWNAAVEKYPNYTKKLNELKDGHIHENIDQVFFKCAVLQSLGYEVAAIAAKESEPSQLFGTPRGLEFVKDLQLQKGFRESVFSLNRVSDITQIAAVHDKKLYQSYVLPRCDISFEASKYPQQNAQIQAFIPMTDSSTHTDHIIPQELLGRNASSQLTTIEEDELSDSCDPEIEGL